MTLKPSSYLLPKFSRVPLTVLLISKISTKVNGTLLNFIKRYKFNVAYRPTVYKTGVHLNLGYTILIKQLKIKEVVVSWLMNENRLIPSYSLNLSFVRIDD